MKYLIVVLSIFLVSCANPAQKGVDMMNSNQHQAAYNTFLQCANQGDSSCINNIGFMYEKGYMDVGEDLDTAVRYYTLAARYGNPMAQNNLVVHGLPIPTIDLAPPAQQTSSGGENLALLTLLLGSAANGYMEGQQRGRERAREQQQLQEIQQQMNKPVKCTSQIYSSSDSIKTTCR